MIGVNRLKNAKANLSVFIGGRPLFEPDFKNDYRRAKSGYTLKFSPRSQSQNHTDCHA